MSKGTTVVALAAKAKETFDRNIDTMIAGFLIRNPDVNPGDIELVFTPSLDGKMHFRINSCPRGILLPDYREDGGGDGGWNACVDEVKRLNARTPEEMRAPLPGTPEDVEAKVIVDG